jgi:hypothetical protein
MLIGRIYSIISIDFRYSSNGLDVEALDRFSVAVESLDRIAREKRMPIKSRIFDVKRTLPFLDDYLK